MRSDGGTTRGWARRFWNQAYREDDHRHCWEDSPAAAGERVAILDLEGYLGVGGRQIGGVQIGHRGIVLDLGCGAGLELVALARRGTPALGLDSALAGLAAARARGRRADVALRLGCADVTALPLPAASVALALDRGCFHQLGSRARRRYGAELARVLAPGGRLILWGARKSCEEEGLVGLLPGLLEAAFSPPWFLIESSQPVTLTAPAGDLAGRRVVLRRRASA